MTRYIVSITDFQDRVAAGIVRDGDVVVSFPKRGTRRDKIRSIPTILWALSRAAADRESHVLVSHPFSSVTSAFLSVARRASFFDDGTAYYSTPPLPRGTRETIDRLLSRRFVDWNAVEQDRDQTYPGMLRHARLSSFFAVEPDLIPELPFPVHAIDTGRSFPPVAAPAVAEEKGITLYLDTRQAQVDQFDEEALMRTLEDLGKESPDGKLHFKPHPSETSAVTVALRQESWAVEVFDSLESSALIQSMVRLVSYYSSGAMSVKAMNRSCEIICLSASSQVRPPLHRLFERLGAVDIEVAGSLGQL